MGSNLLPVGAPPAGRRGLQPRPRESARLQSAPTGATVVAVYNRACVIWRAFKARLRERRTGIDKGKFSQDFREGFYPPAGRRGLQPRPRESARFQSAPTGAVDRYGRRGLQPRPRESARFQSAPTGAAERNLG